MPNVTVCVRVRPLNAKEKAKKAFSTIDVQDGTQVNLIDPDDKMGGIDYLRLDKSKDKSYAFDTALDVNTPQEKVYAATTEQVVPSVISGSNACCFAYGATGSGKTYTMVGSPEDPGVIPRTVEALFAHIQPTHVIHMQYIEIYNEQIKDLLAPGAVEQIDVREDPKRGTFVAGASAPIVCSQEELEEKLAFGNRNRTTKATGCNDVSSRSHAVLQLHIEAPQNFNSSKASPTTRQSMGAREADRTVGKLSLIDLAGSERAKKTGNSSGQLNEGANINRSLLALANCITALTRSPAGIKPRVPYRDSKLTRLLKDSLGGHCMTVIIANVSPASDQFDETLNALKYANRAKNIKTKEIKVGLVSTRSSFAELIPYQHRKCEVPRASRASKMTDDQHEWIESRKPQSRPSPPTLPPRPVWRRSSDLKVGGMAMAGSSSAGTLQAKMVATDGLSRVIKSNSADVIRPQRVASLPRSVSGHMGEVRALRQKTKAARAKHPREQKYATKPESVPSRRLTAAIKAHFAHHQLEAASEAHRLPD